MPASIAGLFMAVICGILCNANWILTLISTLITCTFTIVYYSILLGYTDYNTYFIVANALFFVFIALYKTEKREKTELLQFAQIRQMNEELKSILMNLPEGIVLINDETSEVALQNQEFNRIFAVPDTASSQNVTDLVKEPLVKIYSESGGPNDFRTDINISQAGGDDPFEKLSIMQASISAEGISFRVVAKPCTVYQMLSPEKRININTQEIVTFKSQKILYQNCAHRMIMIRSITHFVKYDKLKMQNHFLEMLTATVSHDMRTPLNSILGLGRNL